MRIFLTIVFVIFSSLQLKAQYNTYEIGGFIGFNNMQTDYGQPDEFSSYFKQNGQSLSIAHYIHFYELTQRWNRKYGLHDHLMIKTELQYISNSFSHNDIYSNSNSENGIKLKAMETTVNMLNTGVNAEYYLKSLTNFFNPYANVSFNPYVGVGVNYFFYNNDLTTSLGDWENDPTLLPEKFSGDALEVGSGHGFAVNFYGGARYKLTHKTDLALQVSSQYFFSDKIDALDAKVEENQSNEIMLNFQLGLVYHLNFN
ncbi:THC0290_0291 family protein [Polaribacter sp. Asnod1-A03]|uniref:THC0290_0291 family protein n=1 Tax=Polaribacter sp. Asnod1-A03 TaxID=3160581 RepID=UPI003867DC15